MATYSNRLIYFTIAANTLIYIIIRLWPEAGEWIIDSLSLECCLDEAEGKPWTLLSYMWLHIDALHLATNMIALCLYGALLTKTAGFWAAGLSYTAGGIAGGCSYAIAGSGGTLIGASAGVMAIAGTLSATSPKLKIGWFPLSALTAAIIAIDLTTGYLTGNASTTAHISGFITGIATGVLMRAINHTKESRAQRAEAQASLSASMKLMRQSGFESLSQTQRHHIINSPTSE